MDEHSTPARHHGGSTPTHRPSRVILVLSAMFLLPFAGVGMYLAFGGFDGFARFESMGGPFGGPPSGLGRWLPWLPRLFGVGLLAFVCIVLYGLWTERRARYTTPAFLERIAREYGEPLPPEPKTIEPPVPAWQGFTPLLECDYCGGKKAGWPERCPGCGAP